MGISYYNIDMLLIIIALLLPLNLLLITFVNVSS